MQQDHSKLHEAIVSHLIECRLDHAERFDEDLEFETRVAAMHQGYLDQCRHLAKLSPEDQREHVRREVGS